MPIEFTCNNCNKMLRVPEGTEGKACQCPACGSVSTVPSVNGSNSAGSSTTTEGAKGEKPTDDGLVRVTCPKCQYPLRCKPELKGSKGQCKQCKHIFVIGETTVAAVELTALVFSCPKCNQLFDGKPEMEGRKGKCHSCGEVFPIKLRQAESESKPKLEKSVKPASVPPATKPYTSQSTPTPSKLTQSKPSQPKPSQPKTTAATSLTNPTSASSLQLICGSCSGAMEVPSTAAGKTVACPHCRQMLQIPRNEGNSSTTKPSIFDQPSSSLFNSSSSKASTGIFDGLEVPSSSPTPYPPSPPPGAYTSYPSAPSYETAAYPPAPYVPTYPQSNYQNPYQSPHPASHTALQQASYSERGGDRDWLRSVASWHRRLAINATICIGCYASLIAGGFLFGLISGATGGPQSLPDEPPWPFMIVIIIVGTVIMASGITALVSYIVLCTKVYETSIAVLYIVGYFLGSCVPLLPLILVILTLNKAAGVLRSYGISVGFFGTANVD